MTGVISKKVLLANIKDMPDRIHVKDLPEDVRLLSKIERSIKSPEEGKGIPHKEVKKVVAQWSAR